VEEPIIKGQFYVNIIQAGYLIKADTFGTSDPFTEIKFNKFVK